MTRLYSDDKIIAEIPDDDDYCPPAWKNTNCRNCGAPLVRGMVKCDFCGTNRQLRSEMSITASYIQMVCN